MVNLSLPLWDKNRSQVQAGSSFTPTLAGRFKSPLSITPAVLRRFKPTDSTTHSQPVDHPLMTLRLSSPSFLDSVVHDGSSDNPLYVIDTDHNVTKIRRSDPKGFVNVSCVRWPTHPLNSMSHKAKDLTGVEVVFGKGHWKPADDFLGYSYSSLSSYRKFYIPHHQHSLKWKPSGTQYACTTDSVKGPVAILEPARQRAPPQLKIFDPLFRYGASRPQRMHNGLPLSLLDFLLVTAMMLVTPNDEWMNVTRTNPSESLPDPWQPSDASSSESPNSNPFLHRSQATPAIERWRTSVLPLVMEGDEPQRGESDDGQSSSSRASRLSFHDIQSMTHHPIYPSGHGLFTRSGSSLSLASHALSYSQHGHGRTRELPVPPIPSTLGSSGRRSRFASSYAPPMTHRSQRSQDEPPPVPPLPSSLSTSPLDLHSPVTIPTPISPRQVVESPTSSIHSRSLPIPPTAPTSKSRSPLSPLSPPNSSPVTHPVSSPSTSISHRPPLLQSRSFSHLRDAVPYPHSTHDYKVPPDNIASIPDVPPLPLSAHPSAQHEAMGRSLSIHTTNVSTALSSASAASATTSLTFDVDLFDLPPAYSSLDVAHASRRLRTISGEAGD